MINNNDLNKEVRDQLDKMKDTVRDGMSRYHILNDEGQVYSRFRGWQDFNMQIMGHQFQKEEFPVVVDLLKQHGHTSVQVKKDKTGTLLHLVDALTIKKETIWVYLLVTPALFLTYYIVGHTGILEAILSHIENTVRTTK